MYSSGLVLWEVAWRTANATPVPPPMTDKINEDAVEKKQLVRLKLFFQTIMSTGWSVWSDSLVMLTCVWYILYHPGQWAARVDYWPTSRENSPSLSQPTQLSVWMDHPVNLIREPFEGHERSADYNTGQTAY